jgi:hypothetical protein
MAGLGLGCFRAELAKSLRTMIYGQSMLSLVWDIQQRSRVVT